jgi:hypothetical protein
MRQYGFKIRFENSYGTAIFEIGFHVFHRETISSPTAKTMVKPPRLDSARLQITQRVSTEM